MRYKMTWEKKSHDVDVVADGEGVVVEVEEGVAEMASSWSASLTLCKFGVRVVVIEPGAEADNLGTPKRGCQISGFASCASGVDERSIG